MSAFDGVVRVGGGTYSINHQVERAGSWWTHGSAPSANVVTKGEDVGEVPVDDGDGDDPWHDVDDCVIIGAEIAAGVYDGDTMHGGVEGAKRGGLMEEGLGIVSERRVLAEGDEDDISTIMDVGLEAHEDADGGNALRRPADLLGRDTRPWRAAFGDDSGVSEEAGTGHRAVDSDGERVGAAALGVVRPVSAMVDLLSSISLLKNQVPMVLRLQAKPCFTESW